MQFIDLPENYPYLREISLVTNQGLMAGKADGGFDPEGHITIAEFIVLANRILGYGHEPILRILPEYSRKSERGHWAEAYFTYARTLGIDYSDNLSPNSELTIFEALNLAERLQNIISARFELSFNYDRSTFFHKYPWADEYIYATRAQIACLVCWFCQNIGNQILEHDMHILHGELFLATAPAHFFLVFTAANSELNLIATVLFQYKCTNVALYQSIKRILEIKNTVLNSLRYDSSAPIYHYTKLDTLISLAPNNFGFRLSNAAFLNDPSEGRLLIQRFQNEVSSKLPFSQTSPGLISPNCIYLASFNPSDDSLPMWVQYGDNATGCAIGFDPTAFGQNIYRVSYDPNDFAAFFNQVNRELSTFKEISPSTSQVELRLLYWYAENCINNLAYLYKDGHYSHEQEFRIIVMCHPSMAKKEDHLREGELFLRTYVEVPYRIFSATFGTNITDPQKLAVGLSSIGLSCSFKQSTIPFRN